MQNSNNNTIIQVDEQQNHIDYNQENAETWVNFVQPHYRHVSSQIPWVATFEETTRSEVRDI